LFSTKKGTYTARHFVLLRDATSFERNIVVGSEGAEKLVEIR